MGYGMQYSPKRLLAVISFVDVIARGSLLVATSNRLIVVIDASSAWELFQPGPRVARMVRFRYEPRTNPCNSTHPAVSAVSAVGGCGGSTTMTADRYVHCVC
jgi:hypothetical protein